MFFFQFLKTTRFPLNLIHKKRYLKFSLLNFRAAVPPFSSARSVLEKLKVNEEESMSKVILMPEKYIIWEI